MQTGMQKVVTGGETIPKEAGTSRSAVHNNLSAVADNSSSVAVVLLSSNRNRETVLLNSSPKEIKCKDPVLLKM